MEGAVRLDSMMASAYTGAASPLTELTNVTLLKSKGNPESDLISPISIVAKLSVYLDFRIVLDGTSSNFFLTFL
jgi:hypothetical protein